MKIKEYYKNSLYRFFTINTPAKNSVITEFLYCAEETNLNSIFFQAEEAK